MSVNTTPIDAKAERRQAHNAFLPTILGLLSILFWGSSVAFSRSLTEQLGTYTAGTAIYGIGGLVSGVFLVASPRRRAAFRRLPPLYLLVCGPLLTATIVTFSIAIGIASNRQQTVEVGIINYLWCSLTLVFSALVLRKRASWLLAPGMIMAFIGVILAMTSNSPFSAATLAENVRAGTAPYALAFVAAVFWALYSALSRKLAHDVDGNATPVFFILSAAILLGFRCSVQEDSMWTPRACIELIYMAAFPAFFGYAFWDIAMRRGQIILLAACSYFTPLLSTFITSIYLGVSIGIPLWISTVLVVFGALLCNSAIKD